MPATDTDQTYVRLRSKTSGQWFVHENLRPTLVAEANEKGTNLTDLVVQILARHFNVQYEPVMRKSTVTADADYIKFEMPNDLQRVIYLTYGKQFQDGIRHVLSQHAGLPMPDVRPRRDGRPQPAAA